MNRSATRPPARPFAVAVALLAFVVVYVALALYAETRRSAVLVEPVNVAAGYAALAQDDFLVDPAHPPFMRMWAALPLTRLAVPMDPGALTRSRGPEAEGGTGALAHRFLYEKNDAGRLLLVARTMIVPWGVLLGILLFAWVHEWLGLPPAVVVLAFYVMEPNLAAHATLATSDLGFACCAFGAVYLLWRACRRWSIVNAVGMAVFLALAAVTAFTVVWLALAVLLLAVGAVLLGRELSWRRGAVLLVLPALLAFGAVWAVHGFRYAPTADGTTLLRADPSLPRGPASAIAGLADWGDAHHLLPNAYAQGFARGLAYDSPRFAEAAAGRQGDARWYATPVACVLKTPVVLILLIAGGLALSFARRGARAGTTLAFALVPIVVFLAAAVVGSVPAGVRNVLLMYPFLLLLAALPVKELFARRRAGRVALGVVLLLWCATYVNVYPNTLTFCSAIVGGPRGGFRCLSDSDYDWGQHLGRLGRWMRESGVARVNLAYAGAADPAAAGVACIRLPGTPGLAADEVAMPQLPGWVAVGATMMTGSRIEPQWRLYYRGFANETPTAVIGNTIRVYRVETWPEPAATANDAEAMCRLATELRGFRRPDDAFDLLRRAVELNPEYGPSSRMYAQALLERGRTDEALDFAQRAVRATPDDPAARDVLGMALALTGRVDGAEREFRRALELDPSSALARERLSWLSTIRGR